MTLALPATKSAALRAFDSLTDAAFGRDPFLDRETPDRAAAFGAVEDDAAAEVIRSALGRRADRADRLRWPIRDGISTWLGTAFTTAIAFSTMMICAVIGAQFAPETDGSAFKRPAVSVSAPAETAPAPLAAAVTAPMETLE